jgi:hypothetical protein
MFAEALPTTFKLSTNAPDIAQAWNFDFGKNMSKNMSAMSKVLPV